MSRPTLSLFSAYPDILISIFLWERLCFVLVAHRGGGASGTHADAPSGKWLRSIEPFKSLLDIPPAAPRHVQEVCAKRLSAPLKIRASSIFSRVTGRLESRTGSEARVSSQFTRPPYYYIRLHYNTTDDQRLILEVEKHNRHHRSFFDLI